jgi:hypothetical protein
MIYRFKGYKEYPLDLMVKAWVVQKVWWWAEDSLSMQWGKEAERLSWTFEFWGKHSDFDGGNRVRTTIFNVILGTLHEKHAVHRQVWAAKHNWLQDSGKPREAWIELFGLRPTQNAPTSTTSAPCPNTRVLATIPTWAIAFMFQIYIYVLISVSITKTHQVMTCREMTVLLETTQNTYEMSGQKVFYSVKSGGPHTSSPLNFTGLRTITERVSGKIFVQI